MFLLSRRNFIAHSTVLASLTGAVSANEPAAKKWKIVVAGGHPGDPEYGCGGTISRYTDRGHDVTLLYLNRGEKGCPGRTAKVCSDLRVSEARRACQVLNAQAGFADQIDGEAMVGSAAYDNFHRVLASESPNVVFTHWPIDNHRDHRAMSNLVYDAWLRMDKSFGLYYYEVSDGEDTVMFSPTDYVDISRTETRKRAACYAHASQSPERFYSLQSQITRMRGLESGYGQAEAFIRHTQSRGSLLP